MIRRALLSLLCGLAFVGPGHAADVTYEAPVEAAVTTDGGWQFAVAPYFWMAGLSGDMGVFGREPVSVDMSFGDILGDLKFGGMAVAELHNGAWGFFGDLIYVKTKSNTSVTRTIGGVPAELVATVGTDSLVATLMAEYRAVANEQMTLDLMAGGRVFGVDNDIDLALSAGGTPIAAFSGSDGDTWIDPMIGAKARFNVAPKWFIDTWGMVGGFGASSDISWDVLAAVGYQWNDRFSLIAGYRALGVDYNNGDGFIYDVVQQGPILGATFRF